AYLEANDATRAALIKNIEAILRLSNGDGPAAAGWLPIQENQLSPDNPKDSDIAASRVRGKQERVVCAQCQRALRFKRIVHPPGTPALGIEGFLRDNCPIGSMNERNYLVFVGI